MDPIDQIADSIKLLAADVREIRTDTKEIKTDQTAMKVQLGQQQIILAEHTRRSTLLEEEFKPVQAHVNMVSMGLKIVGAAATVIGLIAAIFEAADYIIKFVHYLGH